MIWFLQAYFGVSLLNRLGTLFAAIGGRRISTRAGRVSPRLLPWLSERTSSSMSSRLWLWIAL